MGLFAKITGRKAITAEGVPYSKCTEIIAVLGDEREVELCVGGVTVQIPRHLRSPLIQLFKDEVEGSYGGSNQGRNIAIPLRTTQTPSEAFDHACANAMAKNPDRW